MRGAIVSLLVVPLLIPSISLSAQVQPPVEPGTRVRVTAPDLAIKKQAGILQAIEHDTLVVRADSTVRYPLASVTQVDVYQGRRSFGAWKGAALGFVAGWALVGIPAELLIGGPEHDWDRGGALLLFGAVGAATGALLGAIVGQFIIQTDSWTEIPLDQLRVSLTPQRYGRLGIGLSLKF